MALSWTSPSRVFLILVLLYGATVQEGDTASTPPSNNTGGNNQTNETNLPETTQSSPTTVHIDQTSTVNVSWIMSERDRFREESERYRVAVIILGIFFALSAVAIVIGLVWFFIIRRRFGTLKSKNQAQTRTTAGQRIETPQHNLTKTQANDKSPNLNAKQKTDNADKQQGKEPSKPNSASTASPSNKRQTNPSDKVQSKGPLVVPKNSTGFYANTRRDQAQSAGNMDTDEQEVYIELDDGKTTSDTSDAKTPTQPSSSEQEGSPDEIYENFTPPSLENYSQLDTENQYDHHYD